MKTYNDVYISARKRLKEIGIQQFGMEARLIAASAAEKSSAQFLKDCNLYITDDYERKVEAMVERRISGEPVAYVTGEWEFYGLEMLVDENVLIPRIDTEVLVDRAIELLRGKEGTKRVLDLCCGSGCVGIAIATNVPDTKVVLVDNSLKALSVSRKNVLKNKVLRTVTCVDADAMAYPPMLLGKFDMIVCNPPYIPTQDILKLDESVRDYEPLLALDGGDEVVYPSSTSRCLMAGCLTSRVLNHGVFSPQKSLFLICGQM